MKYYCIPTNVGMAAMSNAFMTGTKVNVTTFVIGDGNGTEYEPAPEAADLRHQVWQGVVTSAEVDPVSPNIIYYTTLLPSNIGGFTMREMGVKDDTGRLIGIGNMPSTPKIKFEDGISDETELIFSLTIAAPDTMKWSVDPTVIIASKKDIAKHNTDAKAHAEIQSMVTAHTNNDSNPHAVTAAQVNAVPTTRKLNEKALSSDIILSAADIKTADGKTIDASLLNKANWLGGIMQKGSAKEWALSAKADRTIAAEITCTDTPYAGYWALDVEVSADGGWRKLTATNVLAGDQWYCIHNVGAWTKWFQLATATPPQEFVLPLAAGYLENQACRYRKNQFGEVQVYFKAVNPAGIGAGQQAIATLPVGFRPTNNMHSVCSASNFNNMFYVFWVTIDGNISVTVHTNIPADLYAGFAGTINFLAAQ